MGVQAVHGAHRAIQQTAATPSTTANRQSPKTSGTAAHAHKHGHAHHKHKHHHAKPAADAAAGAQAVKPTATTPLAADSTPAAALQGAAALGAAPTTADGGGGVGGGCDMPAMGGAAAAPASVDAGAAAPTTAATAAPAGATQGAALIQTAAAGLQGSDVAQQVLAALQSNGATINVVDDAQFAAQYGARTGGIYDPTTKQLALPSKTVNDPEQLQLVLLHEGVHWLQDNVQGGAEGLGGAVGQALQSAGAIEQPTPGSKAETQHDEAQAYLLEALVANQLGKQDEGLGVDSAGRAMGYQQILARVQATPEYA